MISNHRVFYNTCHISHAVSVFKENTCELDSSLQVNNSVKSDVCVSYSHALSSRTILQYYSYSSRCHEHAVSQNTPYESEICLHS